jgi:hypothetical protein
MMEANFSETEKFKNKKKWANYHRKVRQDA